MLKSMTGFGSHMQSVNNAVVTSEIKTLNSKFLDLSLKLPKHIASKELEIRTLVTDYLKRGKISLSVQIEGESIEDYEPTIDENLFNQYLNHYKYLEKASGRTFKDILRLALESPNVQNISQDKDKITDEFWISIQDNIKTALNNCIDARSEEGQKLKLVLSSYIRAIRTSLEQVIILDPERLTNLRLKLKTNIIDLLNSSEYDKERLEQELIYFSEKLDISEEIERLKIHLNSFEQTLSTESEQHGKRLGFISQEMGREINTIGSKANSSAIQKYVILMKEELEKIKEQTLNVL